MYLYSPSDRGGGDRALIATYERYGNELYSFGIWRVHTEFDESILATHCLDSTQPPESAAERHKSQNREGWGGGGIDILLFYCGYIISITSVMSCLLVAVFLLQVRYKIF